MRNESRLWPRITMHSKILLVIIGFFSLSLHANAWKCHHNCPDNFFSGSFECKAWKSFNCPSNNTREEVNSEDDNKDKEPSIFSDSRSVEETAELLVEIKGEKKVYTIHNAHKIKTVQYSYRILTNDGYLYGSGFVSPDSEDLIFSVDAKNDNEIEAVRYPSFTP